MTRYVKFYLLMFLMVLAVNMQAQRADGHHVIYEMNIGMFTSQGTFAAAQTKLTELHDLGVDIVWLMPIYPRGSSKSPYAVTDYKGVNPNYGTLANLKSFVTAAHNLGMQVWLDWVPNHTANEHPWVSSNRSYYGSAAQPGTLIHPNNYPDVYQLNYSDSGLKNAMNDALKYWIDEADVDGYRFDYVSSSTILGSYWIATNPMLKSYMMPRMCRKYVIMVLTTFISTMTMHGGSKRRCLKTVSETMVAWQHSGAIARHL